MDDSGGALKAILLLAALGLTVRALIARNWSIWWVADVLWLGAGLADLFWYGPVFLLLAYLHLAAAIATRWQGGLGRWLSLLLVATAVWTVLLLGLAVLNVPEAGLILFPLTFFLGTFVMIKNERPRISAT